MVSHMLVLKLTNRYPEYELRAGNKPGLSSSPYKYDILSARGILVS